jgi:putative two-component system response regulator
MNHLILLIDDDPAVLGILKNSLQSHFRLRIATLGRKGLELAQLDPLPGLILLDVQLPDMRGYEVCAALKGNPLTAAIPVMFLTNHSDAANVIQGLNLGAVDYISKPIEIPILLARVKTHLRLREATTLLRDQNQHLEFLVADRTLELEARTHELEAQSIELQLSQDMTFVALGSIAETRDNETGNHVHRTRAYVKTLVNRIRRLPQYQNDWPDAKWAMIWKSAPLHDIGKVGIPDSILLHPGKLSAEEFSIMKRHPTIALDALLTAEKKMGATQSYLWAAKEIAYSHHERWDGQGYPEGLSGEAIPLSGRIMAIADVYDALISERCYKPAWPHQEAVALIQDGRGKHFDPVIVDCFMEDPDEFHTIALRFSDKENQES